MGGGISAAVSMEKDKNAFKSVALVSNSEFYNNSASSKGGGMVYDLANSYVKNCLFEANDATAHGGAGWIYTSAFAAVNSLYQYNSAGYEGGGLFKAFFDDTDLPYCTALYAVTFVKNYAGSVGRATMAIFTLKIACHIFMQKLKIIKKSQFLQKNFKIIKFVTFQRVRPEFLIFYAGFALKYDKTYLCCRMCHF